MEGEALQQSLAVLWLEAACFNPPFILESWACAEGFVKRCETSLQALSFPVLEKLWSSFKGERKKKKKLVMNAKIKMKRWRALFFIPWLSGSKKMEVNSSWNATSAAIVVRSLHGHNRAV